MDRKSIFNKVQDIFREIFADETLKISDKMTANDLESWDSIMHINLMEAIQDEFNILFDFDEIAEMVEVNDIISAVSNKVEEIKKI